MRDLDAALRDVVNGYQPAQHPPFEALARRHKRRRARLAATGAATVLAVVGVVTFVAVPALTHGRGSGLAGPVTASPTGLTAPSTGAPTEAPTASSVGSASPLATAQGHVCPTASPAAPGGPVTIVDYIAALQLGDRQYVRTTGAASRPPTTVGATIATTQCKLADSGASPDYRMQDGDATFLPVGTPVHAIVGFDPAFRVAVAVNGTYEIYEASAPAAGAKTGADVFPGLRAHIVAILVLSETDGVTVLGSTTDRARVATMVDELMSAPYVDLRGEFGNPDFFIGLKLDDGTVVTRQYIKASGSMLPGLTLPAAFTTQIRALVK